MAEDANEKFEAAVLAIKGFFEDEQWEQALPFCLKALECRPDAVEIKKCRIFALLQLSRWNDALSICDKYGSGFEFERAYCLYRLNRFQEALDILVKDTDSDESSRERLEAQVRYRMGDYEKCSSMYEKLYEQDSDEVGLLVNAAASCISGDKPREVISLVKDK